MLPADYIRDPSFDYTARDVTSHLAGITLGGYKPQMRKKKDVISMKGLVTVSIFFFFLLFSCSISNSRSQGSLTENNMAVKHGLPLFLDLPPPALLSVLHFVQHVRPRVGTGQNVVSVGKRLLVLKTKKRGV